MDEKAFTIALSFLLVFNSMLVLGVSRASDQDTILSEDNGAYFEVEILDYPDEVELGEEFEIEYYIENTGDLPGEQEVSVHVEAEVAGQEVWSESESEEVILLPGDEKRDVHTVDTSEVEEEYSGGIFEVEVDVNILFETEDDYDEATITIIMPGLVPGFMFILLMIGLALAVIIYQKKKR